MKTKRTLLLLLMLPLCAFAQQRDGLVRNPNSLQMASDSAGKWDFHVNMGMGVTTGFGQSTTFMAVAPTVEFKPNDKWRFSAGFMALNSFDPARFYGSEQSNRSLAPRREGNSHLALGAKVSAAYQVNDRLWVAGTLWHVGGQALTPGYLGWYGMVPAGLQMDLNATAVTGELHYQFEKGNSIGFYFTYVNDRTGALAPFMFNPMCGAYPMGYDAFSGAHAFGSPWGF